jgi:hypothetical protein
MNERMMGEVMTDGPTEEREMTMNEHLAMKQEYRPKRQELLREYELRVKFLSVGCIVSVGCKDIAFTTVDEAAAEIHDYLKDPYGSHKRWNDIFNNQD